MPPSIDRPIRRIGFISSRIRGTDGVSLEIGKWAEILEHMGYPCCFIAGRTDRPADRSAVIDAARLDHPDILEINAKCFGRRTRTRQLSRLIHLTMQDIKDAIYEALEALEIDLLIAQNILTIPLNVPLGAALVEVIIETQIPCIAHHHDFVWERERFLVNAVNDYLSAVFPPRLKEIEHVVINSQAALEFARRTGLPCRLIPNVMNFDHPPPPADEYSRGFRRDVGLADDDLLILQPTRVVQRKGIELSIELVRRLEDPRCKLVVTHSEGDEGPEYPRRVRSYAELLGVDVVFAADWIADERCTTGDGRKQYSVWDAYRCADLVTYPSTYEGFGNAFLEAVYFKVPTVCNRYSIFRTDIEPLGFRGPVMDGYVTDAVVESVRQLLSDADYRRQVVDHNYQVAKQYFSYERVEAELRSMIAGLQRPRPV